MASLNNPQNMCFYFTPEFTCCELDGKKIMARDVQSLNDQFLNMLKVFLKTKAHFQ